MCGVLLNVFLIGFTVFFCSSPCCRYNVFNVSVFVDIHINFTVEIALYLILILFLVIVVAKMLRARYSPIRLYLKGVDVCVYMMTR